MSGRKKIDVVDLVGRALEELGDDPAGNVLHSSLYKPHPNQLRRHLKRLRRHMERKAVLTNDEVGKTLEKAAGFVFGSLAGVSVFENYEGMGSQYDLLVSGEDIAWEVVCKRLGLKSPRVGVFAECKATSQVVGNREMLRLCALMDLQFRDTVGLGVLVTLKGASGHPKNRDASIRSLRDSLLTQVLFKAKDGRSIVVFDLEDLEDCTTPGSLLTVLQRKLRVLEGLSGLRPRPASAAQVVVPKHLEQCVPRPLKRSRSKREHG